MNFTITAPNGTTNHGNPNLLCTPPQWRDYLIFYFANYFAHAATVVTLPGQSARQTLLVTAVALLLPVSGVMRAMDIIFRRPALAGRDAFQVAARAGALCMVVPHGAGITSLPRDTATQAEQGLGSPSDNDADHSDRANLIVPEGGGAEAAKSASGSSRGERYWWECTNSGWRRPHPRTKIHGEYWFPPGAHYRLLMVPYKASLRFAKHVPPPVEYYKLDRYPTVLASTYNLPKLMVSLIQVLWAVTTIYQTRGDQIAQYGYAAFGLTVIQYAWVSIVNTLANLLSPDYPVVFLVRTPAMAEAEAEGAVFNGVMDVELDPSSSRIRDDGGMNSRIDFWGFIFSSIPLIIVGVLTHFRTGSNSTSLERGFTMSWLVLSMCFGPFNVLYTGRSDEDGDGDFWSIAWSIVLYLFLGVASVGGLVVVGLMMRDFGVCTLIG